MFDPERHADRIAEWVGHEVYHKYTAGQKEHGGKVTHKPVLGHLAEELLDALVYTAVLQEQMQMILKIAMYGADEEHDGDGIIQTDALKAITNLCLYGNENGELEEELTGEPSVVAFGEVYGKHEIDERFNKWLTK